MIEDLQAAAVAGVGGGGGQHVGPPPQSLVLEHMELPVDCHSEGCLLSDEDKGRLARLEVRLLIYVSKET